MTVRRTGADSAAVLLAVALVAVGLDASAGLDECLNSQP
jgi:hypothetical protein